mmetsp:Transcript_37203/g.64251  ORF Transcript_37203/g.64251 Transcript_37203/m.64251 type:complete len:353 (+) Transcript_37203:5307-6365(+)
MRWRQQQLIGDHVGSVLLHQQAVVVHRQIRVITCGDDFIGTTLQFRHVVHRIHRAQSVTVPTEDVFQRKLFAHVVDVLGGFDIRVDSNDRWLQWRRFVLTTRFTALVFLRRRGACGFLRGGQIGAAVSAAPATRHATASFGAARRGCRRGGLGLIQRGGRGRGAVLMFTFGGVGGSGHRGVHGFLPILMVLCSEVGRARSARHLGTLRPWALVTLSACFATRTFGAFPSWTGFFFHWLSGRILNVHLVVFLEDCGSIPTLGAFRRAAYFRTLLRRWLVRLAATFCLHIGHHRLGLLVGDLEGGRFTPRGFVATVFHRFDFAQQCFRLEFLLPSLEVLAGFLLVDEIDRATAS